MNSVYLNLARKWRSKNFDQIVGQELSIKMLKNSLYLNHFFPVYLFAGNKGCGKTSTARVFAAAINCEQLPSFQQQPRKTSIPCLVCTSCTMMLAGNHPDFIEIDAASNTGVDNVRAIIDAASFLPLMGRKRIYLIDEAHMLSKAAFNAFLKILEEPPKSALFMLATTDTQKIIETVRSRCFQLFFKPVTSNLLIDHLVHLCLEEKIAYELQGLEIIIRETGGCVRDALNLLEQVRFSHSSVTPKAVLAVLGHLDEGQLVQLLRFALVGNVSELLRFLSSIGFETLSADYVWQQLIELVRALIWVKYGLEPRAYKSQIAVLKPLATSCSWPQLHAIIDLLHAREAIFLKTTAQHAYLEMVLLLIARQSKNLSNDEPSGSCEPQAGAMLLASTGVHAEVHDRSLVDTVVPSTIKIQTFPADNDGRWKVFIESVEVLQDPLVNSIFKQGIVRSFDNERGALEVEFSKELGFFKDRLDTTAPLWAPLLRDAFGPTVVLTPLFTGATAVQSFEQAAHVGRDQEELGSARGGTPLSLKKNVSPQQNFRAPGSAQGMIDISDTLVWKKASMLVRHFPGTVHELQEG